MNEKKENKKDSKDNKVSKDSKDNKGSKGSKEKVDLEHHHQSQEGEGAKSSGCGSRGPHDMLTHDQCLRLHELWLEYAQQFLLTTIGDGNAALLNACYTSFSFSSLELVGARMRVVACRQPRLVGVEGVVYHISSTTIHLSSSSSLRVANDDAQSPLSHHHPQQQQQQQRTYAVPLAHSILEIDLPSLSSSSSHHHQQRPQQKQQKQVILTIYGNNWIHDRNNAKKKKSGGGGGGRGSAAALAKKNKKIPPLGLVL